MIAFLHTALAHVATFERLLHEVDPSLSCQHRVDAPLLDVARAAGTVSPALAARIAAAVAVLAGAGGSVIVCTCSTIGGAAEAAPVPAGVTVLRIDRPMAARAVACGTRIAVVAALQSTVTPTTELLRDEARRAGRAVDVIEVLCSDAWPHFERGDLTAYLDVVGTAVERAAQLGDVVVLAQASMAPAAERAAHLPVPVLSSLRPGIDAAVQAYRSRACRIAG